jgi:hypothetical protein
MTSLQSIRGDKVEVVFREGVDSVFGAVVNSPHQEETDEKLGWIIQNEEGLIYSLGQYWHISKLV